MPGPALRGKHRGRWPTACMAEHVCENMCVCGGCISGASARRSTWRKSHSLGFPQLCVCVELTCGWLCSAQHRPCSETESRHGEGVAKSLRGLQQDTAAHGRPKIMKRLVANGCAVNRVASVSAGAMKQHAPHRSHALPQPRQARRQPLSTCAHGAQRALLCALLQCQVQQAAQIPGWRNMLGTFCKGKVILC